MIRMKEADTASLGESVFGETTLFFDREVALAPIRGRTTLDQHSFASPAADHTSHLVHLSTDGSPPRITADVARRKSTQSIRRVGTGHTESRGENPKPSVPTIPNIDLYIGSDMQKHAEGNLWSLPKCS